MKHLCGLLLITPSLLAIEPAQIVPVPKPDAEFKAAREAEKKGEIDAAALHYENILDSTRTPTKATTRAMLYGKLKELKRKLEPNRDPAKAGEWKVKAYAFRTTDVSWKDEKGTNRHALFRFTDAQITNLRHEMTNFAAKVWEYTHGNLRIGWDLNVIDKPLSEWHGWPDLGVCMPYLGDLKHGEADSIFVFAKAERGKEDARCDPLQWDLWGGTIGVTAETKGACYIGFNCGPDPAEGGSGELELHEWSHAAEMGLRWAQAYGDEEIVDWTGDGGGYHEDWGLWKRPQGDRHWLDFYQTIMRDWTTRKMWRELSITRRSNNPWLNDYVRDFLAVGPFEADEKPHAGLEEDFISESSVQPKLGKTVTGKEWKLASAPGKYVTLVPVFGQPADHQIYYLAFAARSGRDRRALLHNQRDGGCKIWHNGQPIYTSNVNREWSSPAGVIDLSLKRGTNLLLVKLTCFTGDWSFNLKLTDMRGSSLEGVQFTLP